MCFLIHLSLPVWFGGKEEGWGSWAVGGPSPPVQPLKGSCPGLPTPSLLHSRCPSRNPHATPARGGPRPCPQAFVYAVSWREGRPVWVRRTAWVLRGPSVAASPPSLSGRLALAAGLPGRGPYHCCLSSLLHSDYCSPEASREHQRAREGRGGPGQQGKLLRVSSAPLGGGWEKVPEGPRRKFHET